MQVGILAFVALINLGSTAEAQFLNEEYTKQGVNSEHQVESPSGGNDGLPRIIKQEGDFPVRGVSGRNDPFDPFLSDLLTSFDPSGLGTSAEIVNRRFQNDQVKTGAFINFGQGLPVGLRPISVNQNILNSAIKKEIFPAQPLLSNDPVGKAVPPVGPVAGQWLDTGRSTVGPSLDSGVGTDPFSDVSLEAIGSVNPISPALRHDIHLEVPHKEPVFKDTVLQGRRVIESILRGHSRVSIPSRVVLPDFGFDTIGRGANRRGDGHEPPSAGGLPAAH